MAGVSADLELDLTAALRGIDDLESSLSSAVSGISGQVEQALEPLTSPVDVTVDVLADTSAVGTELATLDANVEPIDIPITVDTSAVDAELAKASDAAGSARESIGGLSEVGGEATTSLGGIAGAASGLTEHLAKVAPEAAAAVAAIAALGAAADSFFKSGVEAEAATFRLNQTFGASKEAVEKIQVGDLSTDLGTLANSLGSTSSAVEQSAASFGQVAQSFGATKEEAAKVSAEMTALAARAVALNPSLGTVEQATQKLGNALITGRAKALAPFQLGLTKAAVEAKAAEIALADGGREVTIFDKQAAGAALAVGKLGTHLQEDIAQGAKNPELQVKSLSASFEQFKEGVSRPLVVPILETLKAFQPISKAAAGALASLVGLVVPLFNGIVTALAPVFTTVFGALRQIGTALQPVFTAVGKVIAALQPVFSLLISPVALLGNAFMVLGPAIKFVGDVVGLVAQGLGVLLSPLKILADDIGGLPQPTEDEAKAMKNFAGETITMADAATTLSAVLGPTGEVFSKFLLTSTGFGRAGVAKDFQALGISADELQQKIGKGDQGLKEFTSAGVEAGKIKLIDVGTGAEISADKIAHLSNNLRTYINDHPEAVKAGSDLLHTFFDLEKATNDAAATQIANIAATNNMSAAQIASLPAQAQYTLGNASAASQLKVLNAEVALGKEQLLAQQGVLAGNAAAFTNLTGQIAAGTLTSANAAEALRVVGLNADQSKLFFDAAKASVESFVSGALATIPTAASVFQTLADKTDPLAAFSLPANLKKQEEAVRAFSANLGLLAAGGFSNLQAELARAGPEATAAFVAQAKISGPEFVKTAEANAASLKGATAQAETDVANSLRGNVVVLGQAAKDGVKAYGGNLDFSTVTKEKVDAVGPAITAASRNIEDDAKEAGGRLGVNFVTSIGSGIVGGTPGVVNLVRDMVNKLDQAARSGQAADAHSPSRLFAALGMDLAAGIGVGIKEGTDGVVAEAEAIVAAAAAAIAGTGGFAPAFPVALPGTPGSAGSGASSGVSGQTGGQTFNVSVTVNFSGAVTEEQAATAGAAVADGMQAQIARQIGVEARSV